MNKKRIITAVVMTIVLTMLLAFGVSAETTEPHWIPNADGTWSYMDASGELVKGELGYWIEGYNYGFDANGIMYTGWVQPHKYDVDYINYGSQYRNSWYYFDASGRAPEYGYHAETGYLFYSDGQVNCNGYAVEWDSETETQKFYVSDKNGVATELVSTGWNLVNGRWYYLAETEGGKQLYQYGLYTIGDAEYYFSNGYMATDVFTWIHTEEDDQYVYIDADGHPIYEGWFMHNGAWNYIKDSQHYSSGIYTIGENQYYFRYDGSMVENQWVYGDRYAGPGGALLKEQWLQNEDGEWQYFNEDGQLVYSGWHTIGETEYYFRDQKMVTNEVWELYHYDEELQEGDYHWYQFGPNGEATVLTDGWALDGESWMYFKEGEPVYDRLYVVDGKEYAFKYAYLVDEESCCQLYSEKDGDYFWYSVNADGTVNKTPGWDTVDGRQVFIQNDGTLRYGWLYYGGNWYFMEPEMYQNTFAEIGGRVYYFNSQGQYTEVYEDGFQTVDDGDIYYFEYGTPAYGWRLINGNWYYFRYDMCVDGVYWIGGDSYYFDHNGIMQTGWIKDENGYYLYADESGHLVSEKTTIDGVTYFFDGEGRLITGCEWTDYEEDVTYLLDENGNAIAKTTDEPGWISYNGKWYYLSENGYFYDYGAFVMVNEEGETQYWFDNYVLMEDYIYSDRYYAPGGALFKDGWFQKDGKWYYANEYGNLYSNGLYYIDETDDDERNGDYYYFNGYEMYVGTFIYDSDIVVTDASGRVVALQPFNEGWNLVNEFGHGVYYYVEDGELYQGWLGDYYLSWGGMVSGMPYEIDGKYYYFADNGLLVKNGWIDFETYDVWMYAKENGELYYNEWAVIGGTWYYFEGAGMLEDGTYWIGDKLHSFAEGGAWLGEASEKSGYADGWHMIDGNWHYVQYGEFVTYGIWCIDGVWYGFDDDGMVTNDFNSEGYYMNGSGVMVPYTGWQLIDGQWYYFGAEHRITTGWFQVGGTRYYGTFAGIATGYTSVQDGNYFALYNFDASGACLGKVTADGWYNNNGTYYYVMKGELVRGETVTIDGVEYSFYGSGEMVANDVDYDYESGTLRLYGANGARVTTEGWYQIYGLWLYVDAQGYLCTGTHIIGGTTYYFNELSYYFYYY